MLDFGKTRRLFSTVQKLAFGERDGGCTFGGCAAPPSHTKAHHIIWWSGVENTDLDNGILLCGFHHHRIHDGGWEIAFQHGAPYFTPPPRADSGRTPHRGGKVLLDAADDSFPVEMWAVLPVVELVETRMVNLDKLGDRASR